MITPNTNLSLSTYSQAVKAYGISNANIEALSDLQQQMVVPTDLVEVGRENDSTLISQNNTTQPISSNNSSVKTKSNGYQGLLNQLNSHKPKATLYQGDRIERNGDNSPFQNILHGKFNSIRKEEATLSKANSGEVGTIAVMRSINTLEQSVHEFTAVRDKLVGSWHEIFNLAM